MEYYCYTFVTQGKRKCTHKAGKAVASDLIPPALSSTSPPNPPPTPLTVPLAALPPVIAPSPNLLEQPFELTWAEAGKSKYCPLYTIVYANNLPLSEDVYNHLKHMPILDGYDESTIWDLYEAGWGGIAGYIDHCVGVCACFTLVQGFPLTLAQVQDHYVTNAFSELLAQHHLWDVDIFLGGVRDGLCLTPLHHF